jgi:hypothetical protein
MAMPNPISVTAFAKLVGLSQGRVSQLAAEGLPVIDGKIDPEAGRKWLADNLDDARRQAARDSRAPAAKRRPRAKPEGKLGAVASLRAHKLGREAQILDLELRRRNGEVIDRAEAERAIFARARQERDVWLGFASRAVAALAAEAGVDPGKAFPVLDRVVRATLGELAATPLRLSEGGPDPAELA